MKSHLTWLKLVHVLSQVWFSVNSNNTQLFYNLPQWLYIEKVIELDRNACATRICSKFGISKSRIKSNPEDIFFPLQAMQYKKSWRRMEEDGGK